ncbi:DUF6498-containing protein [Halorussus amylolyticus]|uniref:DUF6498-containing protein n=1 Tax=Halorussus amylolyticus TaxID=1126242 RepID=UPI00104E9E67|nr:DUF6498-containing protein [Halorussus amylolyticus]
MNRPPVTNQRVSQAMVVASNLIPVVAVVSLGWSATVLVGLYVVEMWAVLFWTAVKVPFAERYAETDDAKTPGPPKPLQDKRGGVRLTRFLPKVYPRNLPVLFPLVVFFGPLELFLSFAVFALSAPTVEAIEQVLVGGFAIFVARGVEFWTDYVRDEQYRTTSPQALARTPIQHLFGVFVLFFVGVVVVGNDAESSGIGTYALAAVVLGKLGYDLYVFWRDHTESGRPVFADHLEDEIDLPPVATPGGDPERTVTPDRKAFALDAVGRGVTFLFLGGEGRLGLLFVGVVALFSFGGARLGLTVAAAIGLPIVALRALVHYAEYGTLEYRLYDDAVVAHDRWLDAPQRAVGVNEIDTVTASSGLPGRLLGTATLDLEPAGWSDSDPLRMVQIRDPETLRERLGAR